MSTKRLPVRQPDWIPTAPIINEATKTIDAPVDRVWSILADHEHWPQWFTVLDTVEVIGERYGVGGERRVSFKGMRMDEEFTAWEPGRHFAFSVVATNRPVLASMAESILLDPVGTDRSALSYRQGIEPAKYRGFIWKAARKTMVTALHDALDQLAERAESS